MLKKITSEKAPKAIGPYSQAIHYKDLIFISGQLPINPIEGKILNDSIKEQTVQTLENIEKILEEANSSWSHVIKVEIFLKDLNHFSIVNELYAKKVNTQIQPARQVIEVSRLPMDSLIEISCIAYTNV